MPFNDEWAWLDYSEISYPDNMFDEIAKDEVLEFLNKQEGQPLELSKDEARQIFELFALRKICGISNKNIPQDINAELLKLREITHWIV
jgi:hypothetical protein